MSVELRVRRGFFPEFPAAFRLTRANRSPRHHRVERERGNVLGSSGLGAVALGFARRHSTYQALRDRGDRALSVRDLIQRELFDSVQELWAVRVPENGAYRLRQALENKRQKRTKRQEPGCRIQSLADFILTQRKDLGIFNVVHVDGPNADGACSYSLLLLAFEVSPADLPEEMHSLIVTFQGSFTRHTMVWSYDNYTYKEVLSRLLPNISVPSGYEVVGHIAHFNLLEQHWPHRFIIGQVCLDKCPCIKTVVAKLGVVSNEFRTFDMEVIAGQTDTKVSLKEHGLQLHFDFQKVYWNSRLSAERGRVAANCKPDEVVLDLCCGVGALALLCARKGCVVVANDLNPDAVLFAKRNAELNKLAITTSCMNAKELLCALFGRLEQVDHNLQDLLAHSWHSTSGQHTTHVVFNLPELALEILCQEVHRASCGANELRVKQWEDHGKDREDGTESADVTGVIRVHCYTFSSSRRDVLERLKVLLPSLEVTAKIRQVRLVSPSKAMFCVEFDLQLKGRP